MRNGTIQPRDETGSGRALVALGGPAPGAAPGKAPAPFVAQLIDARERAPARQARAEQAVRRYGLAEALTLARSGRRFERLV